MKINNRSDIKKRMKYFSLNVTNTCVVHYCGQLRLKRYPMVLPVVSYMWWKHEYFGKTEIQHDYGQDLILSYEFSIVTVQYLIKYQMRNTVDDCYPKVLWGIGKGMYSFTPGNHIKSIPGEISMQFWHASIVFSYNE
jgi:hypothetical protein